MLRADDPYLAFAREEIVACVCGKECEHRFACGGAMNLGAQPRPRERLQVPPPLDVRDGQQLGPVQDRHVSAFARLVGKIAQVRRGVFAELEPRDRALAQLDELVDRVGRVADGQDLRRPLQRHRADGPPDGPRGERPVELPEAPLDARVAVRIVAVERVLVVQLDHRRERLARRRAPFENLLAPQHAQVIVDAAFGGQLPLCGVP